MLHYKGTEKQKALCDFDWIHLKSVVLVQEVNSNHDWPKASLGSGDWDTGSMKHTILIQCAHHVWCVCVVED